MKPLPACPRKVSSAPAYKATKFVPDTDGTSTPISVHYAALVCQGSGATGCGTLALVASPACPTWLLEPVTFLCRVPSPFRALLAMVCFSDSAPLAVGASVCHVSAEDVNLLYALQQFGT